MKSSITFALTFVLFVACYAGIALAEKPWIQFEPFPLGSELTQSWNQTLTITDRQPSGEGGNDRTQQIVFSGKKNIHFADQQTITVSYQNPSDPQTNARFVSHQDFASYHVKIDGTLQDARTRQAPVELNDDVAGRNRCHFEPNPLSFILPKQLEIGRTIQLSTEQQRLLMGWLGEMPVSEYSRLSLTFDRFEERVAVFHVTQLDAFTTDAPATIGVNELHGELHVNVDRGYPVLYEVQGPIEGTIMQDVDGRLVRTTVKGTYQLRATSEFQLLPIPITGTENVIEATGRTCDKGCKS